MTMWVVLIILAIGVIWLVNKKPLEEVQQQQETAPLAQHSPTISSPDEDADELIAVITAAIAEFTNVSADEFKVLTIRRQSENWALTARQSITYNHL